MTAPAVTSARYQQVCPLASGGMAELHLARTTGPGGFERLVVVKRLRPQLAASPGLVQMLLDEARIAATLQHGNIVQVHDVTLEGGTVSVVMEYLHGQDARALIRRARARSRGALPLDQAVAIALGVCAGLHHAHERVDSTGKSLDIVHRDVTPDNVFVTYDGGVKLIDFGIARARTRLGQTDEGFARGKPGYMAPEQVLCRAVDRRTDVHAAAVLLYEMTCGRLPCDGATDYELVSAVVEADPVRPRDLLPSYPEDLEQIVLRGLAREPGDRYRTALEMQRALEGFARGRGLDLSGFGLAQLMERLFGDNLEAWRSAERDGRSLADHVAALRSSSAVVEPAGMSPAPVEPDPTMPRHGRLRRRVAIVGLAGLIGAGLWWWQTRTIADPAPSDREIRNVASEHGPSPGPSPAPPPAIARDPAPPPPPAVRAEEAVPARRPARRRRPRPAGNAPARPAPADAPPVDLDAPLPR